jgi:programmed cell death protein 5
MEEKDLRAQEEALRARLQQQQIESENKAQLERQLEGLLRTILETGAFERLANVKLANYEKYIQVSQGLIGMHQQGRIEGRVSEEQLKDLLSKLANKREINIRRK